MKPKVSVIIPCRNEEKYIGEILDTLIKANLDLPIEIIVVDGMSTDNTRKIVKSYVTAYPEMVKMIDNPEQYVPHALNKGIKSARGDILIRMDAHAVYPPDYVKKLIKWHEKTDALNIGPVIVPIPAGNSPIKKAIAIAQRSLFGVGNSLWRVGVKEPTYADTTLWFCMKKDVIEKIGYFNEALIRNQDAEFNARILKFGGKNLVVPDVKAKMIVRDSLYKLAKQYFQYGYYRALSAKITKKVFSIRQFIPPLFFIGLIFSLLLSIYIKEALLFALMYGGSYLTISVVFSVYESTKHRNLSLIFTLPLVYFIIHFAFAIGFILGFINFILLNNEG